MDATVIVTGAAGFIGSHVCEALLGRGQRVVGVDNFDPLLYGEEHKRRNVEEVRGAAGGERFELVEADIAEAGAMRALFERVRPEGVIHLAARAGVRPSIADPAGYARANVLGTASVLEAARGAGCSRVVVASSSSVYGNNRKVPFAEDDAVNEPISPYAATKRACELIAHTHWHLTGMPTACLRFFTVYGPRQRPDLAIRLFMERIARGEPVTVFGDGSMSRDFTYIDDVVSGVLAAYDRIGAYGYRIWNLGSDRPVRVDALVAAIARVVGREARVEHRPAMPGDVERTWADLGRASADLGYRPRTGLEEGLGRQWGWVGGVLGQRPQGPSCR